MASDLDHAWDRMEQFASRLAGDDVEIEREGRQFQFFVEMGDHDVALWVNPDSPRYCAKVDGVLSMRLSNLAGMDVVLAALTARPERLVSSDVWDTES